MIFLIIEQSCNEFKCGMILSFLLTCCNFLHLIFISIDYKFMSVLLLLLSKKWFCSWKVILVFFLQFKKCKYIPKHIICLCSGFGSLQCAACSKEHGLNLI